MGLIDKGESKSEQEVIQILKEQGIQVIMKPIALVPSYQLIDGCEINTGLVEMDIYDAVYKLKLKFYFGV